MAIIFISNNSNIPKAETITITESDHVLCKGDSMQAWIAHGGTIETWNRLTSLVYITDKTKADVEYLLEPLINNTKVEPEILHDRKWYWSEPDPENPFYQSLYFAGEVHVTHDEILPYLLGRT